MKALLLRFPDRLLLTISIFVMPVICSAGLLHVLLNTVVLHTTPTQLQKKGACWSAADTDPRAACCSCRMLHAVSAAVLGLVPAAGVLVLYNCCQPCLLYQVYWLDVLWAFCTRHR
jgi:hypothetical protein